MGFHMVKGRGQADLNSNVTIEEGIEREEAFFLNSDPWRSVDDKSLFGTKNLRVKLGDLQMGIIRSSFDDIVKEMKKKRDDADKKRTELGEIPSTLAEKRALFRSIKDEYVKTIGPIVLGGKIHGRNSNSDMKASAKFLLASKEFMVKLKGSRLANISNVAVGVDVLALVNGEEVSGNVCFRKNGLVYVDSQTTDAGQDLEDSKATGVAGSIIEFDDGGVGIECENKKVDKLLAIPEKMVRRDPAWILQLIELNRPYQLPIFMNIDAFVQVVADLINDDWVKPSFELLNFTSDLMEEAAIKYVKGIKTIESLPSLSHFLQLTSEDVVRELKKKAVEKVEDLIERESIPYTQNDDLYNKTSELRSQRLYDELMSMVDAPEGNSIDKEAAKAIISNVFRRNQRLSLDEHMAEEMQHALIALKRFIDSVPMICIEIMQNFPDKINEKLSVVLDEVIERRVVAPPEKAKAMKELERKIETLDLGIRALRELF